MAETTYQDAGAKTGRDDAADMRYRIKSIFGGSIGNLVEWYDWYVYSAFALYFAKAFFPGGSPTVQLLDAAAVFAVGFLMRPIGGWILGYYADRKGKAALTLSVTLMCLGSLIVAVTPTYGTIGILAPIVLILARLLPHLSLYDKYHFDAGCCRMELQGKTALAVNPRGGGAEPVSRQLSGARVRCVPRLRGPRFTGGSKADRDGLSVDV